ncbi:MAG TPA: FKBP-type peptidyl-prolyl cis-trans isomerase [Ferruginibacter sp.]|nr:FKBP-type peptidyl-prolyl cis-trans isomerase [Ferruginibacter sp.]HMP20894.1 FKBP-type peptidyl-prolyl cis-trans isomerase [Ferruginibacter sp.]
MKKNFAALALFTVSIAPALAQVKKKPTATTAAKPAAPAVVMKNALDSFCYAIGVNIASNLKHQSVEQINYQLLQAGMEDVFKNKGIKMTEQQTNSIVQTKLQEAGMKKVNVEKEKGKAFAEANKKRKEVTTLPNGLQYEVLASGDPQGPMPTAADTFVAHYAGTLIDGKEFDNSYKRGEPLELPVGSVIPGWTQILQMMHVGDKWKVYIPSDLGYGDRGAGADIPGGATLVFEMELVGIKPAAVAPVEEKEKQE